MTGCYEEELARVAGIGDEEAPGPADGWEIGRPRAVEKGSMARTVPTEVGTGLYNLVNRNTADSRSSTSTSLMPFEDRIFLH